MAAIDDEEGLDLEASFEHAAASLSNLDTYTFTDAPIGDGEADDDIFVIGTAGYVSSSGTVEPSATIGGNAATMYAAYNNDRVAGGIAHHRLTGPATTQTVAFNFDSISTTPRNCQISIYRVRGHPTGIPKDSGRSIVSSGVQASRALDVSAGGIIIAGAHIWMASGSASTISFDDDPSIFTENVDTGAIETVFAKASAIGLFSAAQNAYPLTANHDGGSVGRLVTMGVSF